MDVDSYLLFTLQWRGLRFTLQQFRSLLEEYSGFDSCEDFTALSKNPRLRKFFHKYPKWREQGLHELHWCQQNNVELVRIGDNDYPQALLASPHPPLLLSYQGHPVWKTKPAIAVVGSRKPSHFSLEWMDLHLPEFLAEKKLCVVSGGARGVDQRAHAIAMRTICPTVCFLPSGLACPYPKEISGWRNAIEDSGGALVSQFSPFHNIMRANFHMRNVLIARLSQMVFVVEARRRSGSVMTARFAMEAGRNLVALPHEAVASQSMGSLDLLCDGASLIRDHLDLGIQWDQSSSSEAPEASCEEQHIGCPDR